MGDIRHRVEIEKRRAPMFVRYAVPDLDHAIEVTLERIEEWDYATDPHGWCHERTTLLVLVDALTAQGATGVPS